MSDIKKNQLTDVTIKSIFNYTMDCNQTANEMLRKIVNGEEIVFNTSINVDDEEDAKVETKAKVISKDNWNIQAIQQEIINRICLEEIHYFIHEDNEVPLNIYGHPLKWTSLMYSNTDSFINLLKTKIGSLHNNQYCLHLHKNFITDEGNPEDGSPLRLCYCLQYIKNSTIKDDNSDCNEVFDKTKLKLACIDIISKNIPIIFSDKDITTQLNLKDKYTGMIKIYDDGTTNISTILNRMKEDSKK